jgi:hypothetical protein
MMLKNLIILFVLLFLLNITISYPQSVGKEERNGVVTFKSSENIYVKFENTTDMKVGDTLFVKELKYLRPVISIKFLSSRSVAGSYLNGKELKVDDKVYAYVIIKKKPVVKDTVVANNGYPDTLIGQISPVPRNISNSIRKNYNGRFSIQSFSNISNFFNEGNYQQWRYSFQFDADSISGSPFSFSNYIVFTYKNGDLHNLSSNVTQDLKILSQNLKVYDLAVNYKFSETSNLWFGRYLNRKVANISSVDGFQYEQKFFPWYAGLIVGSRPDFKDLGFNFNLFEYGGYFGRTDTVGKSYMENTIAVMQQTNNMITDRRFLYFQHNNNLIPFVNLFLSSEVDLYKKEMGISKNTFSLTGIFTSVNYYPDKAVSFSFSYDSRKDVIYYETYRSFADSIIENQTRQGFRAGVNLRPFDNFFVSLSAGYRFQPSDPKPSRSFSGTMSYGNIPWLNIVPSVSFIKLFSSYIDGVIWGAGLSKNLMDIADVSVNYSNNQYNFLFGSLKQDILSADLSARIWQRVYLTLSYEGTFQQQSTWGRFLLDLTARF